MGDGWLIGEDRSGHRLVFDTVGESVLGLGIWGFTELMAGVAPPEGCGSAGRPGMILVLGEAAVGAPPA